MYGLIGDCLVLIGLGLGSVIGLIGYLFLRCCFLLFVVGLCLCLLCGGGCL